MKKVTGQLDISDWLPIQTSGICVKISPENGQDATLADPQRWVEAERDTFLSQPHENFSDT